MPFVLYFYTGAPTLLQVRVPTENAIPIGPIAETEAARWCAINTLLIPYGGLLAANLHIIIGPARHQIAC